MIAKCANPDCPVVFDHRLRGKFFRFSRGTNLPARVEDHSSNHVEHFWLCPRCCQIFTLVYAEGIGVGLQLRERSAAELAEQLTAA